MASTTIKGDLMSTNKPSVYEINKASVLRRFAAWLIDFIIFVVLATGLLSLTSIIFNYDAEFAKVEEKYLEHGIYTLNPSATDGSNKYITCTYYREDRTVDETSACYIAWNEFFEDEEAVAQRMKCDTLMIIMLTTSSLIALLLTEFILPLIFKNGQTIGKKIMHIGLIGNDRIRIRVWQLFARVIIGRFVIETMIPIYCVVYAFINTTGGLLGLLIIIIIAIIEVAMLGATKNNQLIHDFVSSTVVIDMDSQYIARNRQDLEDKINEMVKD